MFSFIYGIQVISNPINIDCACLGGVPTYDSANDLWNDTTLRLPHRPTLTINQNTQHRPMFYLDIHIYVWVTQ